jgi:ATP-dependent Clp protease ATP-binding subunit ClpC
MYERFTDRARKVMQLANQEAQRLCHQFIGLEHLLIGIAREGSGVACTVMRNLGVSVDNIIPSVRKFLVEGTDFVTMGKLQQTPRTKSVIMRAIEEAKELHHNYVGTEHLLLGLLHECSKTSDGVAERVIAGIGLTHEKALEGIKDVLGQKVPPFPEEAFRTFWKAQILMHMKSLTDEELASIGLMRKPEENLPRGGFF